MTGDDSRERRKRALIGAGIGALAGGAVGRYMDQQEAALRERLARSGVSVTRMGDEIQLVMPGNVTFETDRADIRADFFEVLSSVGVVLAEYDQTLVEISGHTDSTGDDAHNQVLSERRAESVRGYLEAQGIQPVRLVARGFGERQPVAANDTADGRQQNRRVELRLVPLTL
jgi:outer membrane protein OmpA-like peptidoglycan-associated protein